MERDEANPGKLCDRHGALFVLSRMARREAMVLRFAAALIVAASSVTPCLAQSAGNPHVEPARYTLETSVRRAWQSDAQGLMELVNAEHARGAERCWNRKFSVTDRIDCFQRLVERHFLRLAITKSAPLQSWCVHDENPGTCLDSMAAQEVEEWRFRRKSVSSTHAPTAPSPPVNQ
jgi:hypothetical protein